MSERKIKFAVIGFGHIGKRHAEMVKRNPQSEIVAVADVDESQKQFCIDNYTNNFFTSADDLFTPAALSCSSSVSVGFLSSLANSATVVLDILGIPLHDRYS